MVFAIIDRDMKRKAASAKAAAEEIEEEDAEERLAKSRERNREHARRTRLRKKAHLQALQVKVKELQEESRLLKQSVEECSIASILLGLSSSPGNAQQTAQTSDTSKSDSLLPPDLDASSAATKTPVAITGRKRKKFVIDDPAAPTLPPPQLKFKIGGQNTVLGGGGKTHINWKTGVFCDENGNQKQLTPEELETLRRERNRMHAKMTRDRKKIFISSVERTIAQLEQENQKMREILIRQVQQSSVVTPTTRIVMPNPSHQRIIPTATCATLNMATVAPTTSAMLRTLKMVSLPPTTTGHVQTPTNTDLQPPTKRAKGASSNFIVG